MLKIKSIQATDKNRHFELLKDRFYEGLFEALWSVGPDAVYHQDLLELLYDVLEEILIGTPSELENIAIAVQVMHPEFSAYAARKKKGNSAADVIHKNTLKIIEKCFSYDKFSDKKASWNAYELVSSHNIRICPYCHSHHINYHLDASAKTQKEQYVFRPPLDHFLPKSRYPYLAVSLHNLIPSCAQCNSSIKSDVDPIEYGLTNPHDNAIPIDISFSAAGSIPTAFKGTYDDIKINLIATGVESHALMEAFLLPARYQWYRHEIKDLIDRYSDHLALPPAFHTVITRERYVLGCLLTQVNERMIGKCLGDIFKELVANKVA
ncbi:hypothetical protein [Herbaspirillum lusitanum]|uniref:hypothetical protein n=1 Tax=Herbaspirillum lusitanum TaxID=213312 RepID=UPI00036F716C|nr:hypothetical protein [Herbaspirillum lusitanum]